MASFTRTTMRTARLAAALGTAALTACHAAAPPPPPQVNAPCSPPRNVHEFVVLDPSAPPSDSAGKAGAEGGGIQRVFVCARVRSARRGRVVEEATGVPIPNAVVTVESWETPAPIGGRRPERRLMRSAVVRSDASGAWAVGEDWAWMRGYLAADGFPQFVDGLCVHAPGYASFVFDPWQQPEEYFVAPPSTIRLSKSASPEVTSPSRDKVSSCGVALEPAFSSH
jgi:hypothetical protein